MKNSLKNMANSNWLRSLNNFSKRQKIILVVLVFILIFSGGLMWYRVKTNPDFSKIQDKSKDTAKQTDKNYQESQNKQNDIQRRISQSDYPSILLNHKSNAQINFNLTLNQNESNAVYGYDRKLKVMKKLYNFLQLPYRATNTSTKVSNNLILQTFQLDAESDQTMTQISWTYLDEEKRINQKDYLGEIPLAYTASGSGDQSKSIPQNVIWFGFTNNSPESLPKKDSDYGKPEYINQGVYIYTRSLKNDVGTYLKDLKNDIEFKISDQYCGSIFYSKTDFWCLNAQRRLINLSTNFDLGEYSKITTTDQGIIYATRNIDDLYSVVDQISFSDEGEPIIQSGVYQTKQGEIVTHIAFTNQQELLIQINRSQNLEFQSSVASEESIKELITTKLQEVNGVLTSEPRPEFDQFTVIF